MRLTKTMVMAMASLCVAACGSGSGADGVTGADSLTTTRAQVLTKINQLRADSSLPALSRWTDAESCADSEATADEAANQPHATFGRCHEYGQPECPGWPALAQISSGCVIQMWMEGPPLSGNSNDYALLASTAYHKLAVGLHVDATGTVWAALDFAP